MTINNDTIKMYLEAFNQWLQMHPSATEMLKKLSKSEVVAEKQQAGNVDHNNNIANLLNASNSSLIYRRVFLFGNGQLFSKAHNWFVPNKLTSKMLTLLENTNLPFGYVIRDTKFSRRNVETTFFAENFEKGDVILRHQAILSNTENEPISFVEEDYYPLTLKLFVANYINTDDNKTMLT